MFVKGDRILERFTFMYYKVNIFQFVTNLFHFDKKKTLPLLQPNIFNIPNHVFLISLTQVHF